jgi:hypothetical protein
LVTAVVPDRPGLWRNAFSLYYDSFYATFNLSLDLDPHISDLGEMQNAVILIYFEDGLIVIHGVIPAISFETDMTDLSTVLL